MNPTAYEFTPEVSRDYLSSLLEPIDEKERQSVGGARAKGAAGGLSSLASTGSEVGSIEANSGIAKNNAISKFNLDVADKKYSERQRDEQEAYQDTERQKSEDFHKMMTQLGYEHEQAQEAGSKHAFEQQQLIGIGGSIIGSVAGAGIGKGLSSYFMPKTGDESLPGSKSEYDPNNPTNLPEEDTENATGSYFYGGGT